MSQSQSTAGRLEAANGWFGSLDRTVKHFEQGVRSLKQRWRVQVFARAADALAKRWIPASSSGEMPNGQLSSSTQMSSHTKILIIPDCFGRLANRLTVLANAVTFAKANDAIVVDLALRKSLNADCLDSKYQIAGCLVFADTMPRQTIITRLLLYILRRNAKEVARRSYDAPQSRIGGIPLLRGERPDRILLDRLPTTFAHDRCIVVTGVHIDAEPPAAPATESLRKLIRPNPDAMNFVTDTLAQVDHRRVTVGVHIRHGDYRVWQDGKYFHPLEDYVQCMKVLQDGLNRKVTFLVVSDEPQDLSCCHGIDDVRRIFGSEEQDLALLAACDYIIATHSSFANWASFHGSVPVLTVRRGLEHAQSRENNGEQSPPSAAIDPIDVGQLNVVGFPTLRPDYIV